MALANARDWLILGSQAPDERTATVLGIASVLGNTWSVADLAALAAVPVAQLLPTVRSALASGILVEQGSDLRFSQRVVRDAYSAGLPGPMRSALYHEAARIMRARGVPGLSALTDKERAVVGLVADGFTNREIASELGISRRTVENHLYRIFPKLGVASRVQLALYAESAE